MLVLQRKLNEQSYIDTPSGERVVVTVVAINGQGVKIGFEAPQAYSINRREIAERIDELKRAKAISDAGKAGGA